MQCCVSSCSRWRKLLLIIGFWEHHLLYPVMWVAITTVASLYRTECLDVSWIMPEVIMGANEPGHICGIGRSVYVHDLLFRLWLLFVVSNWVVVLCLDWAYRRLVVGRNHFERVPQGRPSRKRSISFALFPLADIFLFVIPTFHAHFRMFLSTKFEYIVSPKETSSASLSQTRKDVSKFDSPRARELRGPIDITNL